MGGGEIDERCEAGDAGLSCALGEIDTEAEQNVRNVSATLRVVAPELLQVTAVIGSLSVDPITDNNEAFLIIDALPPVLELAVPALGRRDDVRSCADRCG